MHNLSNIFNLFKIEIDKPAHVSFC